ncbi:MAG: LuxR family transcriptional regulator [Rhodanobacter sp.]|nr:MAG: LuxR family transcriptional regulator [Rhodanobacter sp.]TAM38596.1 MAG: LuxR family transcriptional regulator [Rhodanobacter sp.]TAN23621.1 MAG: LuxR family transcriptional regulator [Rhodanobacter sp.]
MTQSLMVNEASNELCASDRMQLFAHGEELLSLSSRSDLANCLGSLRAWLDVSEIVVATGTIETLPDACVIGSGYDPEWMELYLREKFVLVDPIVRAIVNGQRFLSRSRAIAENNAVAKSRPHRLTLERFIEAAQDYRRLSYGFASGVVFNGRIALCSVVTSLDQGSQRAPLVLRALRPMLYQALMRVLLPEPVFPNLSQREVAILECLASGHGDTQIADAMSISASTVRFHLGNLFEKLGARNRCHAVAIGFQSGLLQR